MTRPTVRRFPPVLSGDTGLAPGDTGAGETAADTGATAAFGSMAAGVAEGAAGATALPATGAPGRTSGPGPTSRVFCSPSFGSTAYVFGSWPVADGDDGVRARIERERRVEARSFRD